MQKHNLRSEVTDLYTVQSTNVQETHALGRRLGEAIATTNSTGIVIALNGNLGAGKTALTQGIAIGLGITTRVTSPTFVFVNEYPITTGQTLVHVDSYRLGEAPDEVALEAFTFGLDEILSRDDVIVVIEWADRLHELLPTDHLQITLTYRVDLPDQREICCMAFGPISSALLGAIVPQN